MFIHSKIDILIESKKNSKKGITLQDIANDMGLSISTLNNIKSGISIPGVDKLEVIANYFGVDMNYFFKSEKTKDVVNEYNEDYKRDGDPWRICYFQEKELNDLRKEVAFLKRSSARENSAKSG